MEAKNIGCVCVFVKQAYVKGYDQIPGSFYF